MLNYDIPGNSIKKLAFTFIENYCAGNNNSQNIVFETFTKHSNNIQVILHKYFHDYNQRQRW